MPLTKEMNVALIGNPNSGKTSLFNRLTGLNQHVGNFPGITVDKKTGHFQLDEEQKANLIDLPGAYSLYPTASDERIVLEILCDEHSPYKPDVIVYVADASNLERHLLLFTQILDLKIPVILAINMVDVAQKEGQYIDEKVLSTTFKVPLVTVNGRKGDGIEKLKALLLEEGITRTTHAFHDWRSLAPDTIERIIAETPISNDYQAILAAHHTSHFKHLEESQRQQIVHIATETQFQSIKAQVSETMERYDKMTPIIQKAITRKTTEEHSFTDRIDSIVTHPFLGSAIFFTLLFLIFQAIFAWASYPMDFIEYSINELAGITKSFIPSGWFANLLTDGIIAGIGGVLVFIPQIAILFIFIAVLEESGYMARAVFLSDGVMRRFGLNGRSIVSLISGAACAIPAIMATRSISNWKERLITIFVTPLISCSARIPVFAVLVAFVVPRETVLGIFNLQGLVIMGLYLLGTIAAITSAWVMKKILNSKEQSFFAMELPAYKMPDWKNVFLTVFEKVKIFVLEAGRIILVISIVLWFMASYGPGDGMEKAKQEVIEAVEAGEVPESELENVIAARQIEASYAGHFGKFIEPGIAPLGFDWKIGIALITSFAAREVFVGTMATIYSVGSSDDEKTILEKMRAERNPNTGQLTYNTASALSLLVFYVFAMQCMSTLAIVKRETNSWKWPLLQVLYMTTLAYLGSLTVFQLLS